MENATLAIGLPRTMKDFIETKLEEGRFSRPSEYIRSLIRDDQDLTGKADLALLVRRSAASGKRADTGRRLRTNKKPLTSSE
jgi:Arc/MetJ-type ribon-helix-helix transcriptional regulator